MKRSRALAGMSLAALLLSVAMSALAADIKFRNAWLRPTYAGQPTAMVYVDIESSEALTLVAANSPVAKGAQLVRVDPPGPDTEAKVVTELPIAAKQVTRLALLGNHVRLLDVHQDLAAGARVPVELTFVDAKGKRMSVKTEAVVRGIVAHKPEKTN